MIGGGKKEKELFSLTIYTPTNNQSHITTIISISKSQLN